MTSIIKSEITYKTSDDVSACTGKIISIMRSSVKYFLLFYLKVPSKCGFREKRVDCNYIVHERNFGTFYIM